MAKLIKSIVINAPVSKIFKYMNEPQNLPEIWPSMVDVKDVKILPNGGASFKFGYKMAGVRFEGFSEDTEFIPNQRTVSKISGGMDGWTTIRYEPAGQATKVDIESEYIVPVPVIGKLAEAVIIKINEQEAVTLLANLQTRMEGV